MDGKLSRKQTLILFSLVCIVWSSCSYRPHHDSNSRKHQTSNEEIRHSRTQLDHKNIIPLTPENGVFYLTAKINDVPMKFIFDTGASTISMSLTEAKFLMKQGTITEEDFFGTANYTDANGDVTEAMLVKLKKVEIGEIVLQSVTASVVSNQEAPLLFGQTALKQLGMISIDYSTNTLYIE